MVWTAHAGTDQLSEIYLRTILKSEYLLSKIRHALTFPIATSPRKVCSLCFSGTCYVSLN